MVPPPTFAQRPPCPIFLCDFQWPVTRSELAQATDHEVSVMSANNPNDGRRVHKQMLKTIISLVVLIGSAVVLFFRLVGLPPAVDARPHVGIGETLAEQAI